MTSLGRVGLDKMIVDVGGVCSTNVMYSLNDGAAGVGTCIVFICIGMTLNFSLSCFPW